MSSRVADCPKCGGVGAVMTAVGMPRCKSCKAAWLSVRDLNDAIAAAREKSAGYVGDPLREDLRLLTDTVRVATMGEIRSHLLNARGQLKEQLAQVPDKTEKYYRTDEAVKALDAITAWLEKMQGKVGEEDGDS